MSRLPPLALTYHGVAEVPLRADEHGLFTRPRALLQQVATLRRWGYRLVTFGELAALARQGRARGLAALTFDDGLADNLETLAPLLDRLGAPATVFVVSGWLGERHPEVPSARILTTHQVRTLAAQGIEIGAHTVTHPDLMTLSYAGALDELRSSRAALEAILDAPVEAAAYPYGHATAETLAACAAAGFSFAARSCGHGSWDEPLNLPRQVMHNGCSLLGLRLKRDDRYESVMRWRAVRGVRRLGRHARASARGSEGTDRLDGPHA